MHILIIERNKIVRDQILVSRQNFQEFAVETGEGFGGLNKTKHRDYDCVFIGCNLQDEHGLELVEHFRESDSETDLVIVTPTKKAKSHQALRARYDVLSLLYVPIEPKEFFRLVARLRRKEVAT